MRKRKNMYTDIYISEQCENIFNCLFRKQPVNRGAVF